MIELNHLAVSCIDYLILYTFNLHSEKHVEDAQNDWSGSQDRRARKWDTEAGQHYPSPAEFNRWAEASGGESDRDGS